MAELTLLNHIGVLILLLLFFLAGNIRHYGEFPDFKNRIEVLYVSIFVFGFLEIFYWTCIIFFVI
jgi:phosphoglycerol transferase MdoB-like AlkP superfamily enzyme